MGTPRTVQGIVGLQLGLAVLLSFLPLTNVLGFERAFVTALACGPMAGLIAVRLASRAPGTPWSAWIRTLELQAVAVGATVLAGALTEWITTACDPREGALLTLLLAGGTSATGAALGILCQNTVGRPRAALAGFYGAALTYTLVRLFHDPQIFAFNPLLGYWPGSLYDARIDLSAALVAHAGLSASLAAAVVGAVDVVTRRRYQRLSIPLVAAGIAVVLHQHGDTLGFDRDRNDLHQAMPARIELDGVRLHLPESVPVETRRALTADIAFRMQQLTDFFGRRPAEEIDIYIYSNAEEKHRLIGARRTQFARPWSHEIHIHGTETPQRSLKHELAHVFAGDFADGLLKVPARAGVFVNIGLVEGMAVAADWPARQMTVHQWARAMQLLGKLPRLEDTLYPAGFWSKPSARSYTALGSFIRFWIDTEGLEPMTNAYRSNDLEAAYGRSLQTLETRWHAFLATVPVDPTSQAVAERRFARRGLVEATCPHAAAALKNRGRVRLARGDIDGARPLLDKAMRYNPRDTTSRLALALAELSRGHYDAALQDSKRAYEQVGATQAAKNAAQRLRLDARFMKGDRDLRHDYELMLGKASTRSARRLLGAKRLAVGMAETPQVQVMKYLTGQLKETEATAGLVELAANHPRSPLIQYLYAKRRARHPDGARTAIAALCKALDLGLEDEFLAWEAQRMLTELLIATERPRAALSAAHALSESAARPVEALEAADWVARAEYHAKDRDNVLISAPACAEE